MLKRIGSRLAVAPVVAMMVSLLSCDGTGPAEAAADCVLQVTLPSASISLDIGESELVVPTISQTDCTGISSNWASDDVAIASVADDGTISGVGPGTTDVTVTAAASSGSSASASIGVSVTPPPQLISVDLQSSFGTEGRDFSGIDSEAANASSAFAGANVWNHIGTTGFDVTTDVSDLVDSEGNVTQVGFTTSAHSAYGNTAFGKNDLLNDYFYWRASLPNGSDDLFWELSGLVPGAEYVLFFNGSNSDAATARQFTMVVDTDGDGSLTDETGATVVSPPGSLFPSAIADATGVIRGRGSVLGTDEPNWGGFQVAVK